MLHIVLLWHLMYCDIGRLLSFITVGRNLYIIMVGYIFKYYTISCGIVIYVIIEVLYGIIIYTIFAVDTKLYNLNMEYHGLSFTSIFHLYSISYGIVIGSFITISSCIVLHLMWYVFCILYDIVVAYHWLSLIEISWYATW